MDQNTQRAGNLVAIALIVSIVTQVVYMAILGGPSPSDPAQGVTHADVVRYFTERWTEIGTVWMIELAAFSVLAVAALVALARGAAAPAAWGALALAGIFNMIQVGFGLSMFQPAATADETLEPVLGVIVSGAFFFYFLAKALIGLAGAGFGLSLFRSVSGPPKAVGALAIPVGLAAAAINILAMPQGTALTLAAGATGTAAALFTGLAAMLVARKQG
jgi:hypothetical protein